MIGDDVTITVLGVKGQSSPDRCRRTQGMSRCIAKKFLINPRQIAPMVAMRLIRNDAAKGFSRRHSYGNLRALWRSGRVAEGAPLLREYTLIAYRGFESLLLRHTVFG